MTSDRNILVVRRGFPVGCEVRHRDGLGLGRVVQNTKLCLFVKFERGIARAFVWSAVLEGVLTQTNFTPVPWPSARLVSSKSVASPTLPAESNPPIDFRTLSTGQLVRVEQLLAGLTQNELRPRTSAELASLVGRSVRRDEADGMKATVTGLLKNTHGRHARRLASAPVKKPERPSRPRPSPIAQRSMPRPTVASFELQLRGAGVRHPINRDSAIELFSGSRRVNGAFQEVSPLKLAGYEVGAQGAIANVRREILDDFVCRFPIPPGVFEPEYRERWGEPGTKRRKQQTEALLRRLTSLNGARPALEDAVGDWESDLAWLLRSVRLDQGRLVPVARNGRRM
ncbi:MAG: hypothetical protein NT062_36400 [Proteobacteria bacterium]|nr:hypothetical protein [Pseudomonadota bacterium]